MSRCFDGRRNGQGQKLEFGICTTYYARLVDGFYPKNRKQFSIAGKACKGETGPARKCQKRGKISLLSVGDYILGLFFLRHVLFSVLRECLL